MRAVPKKHDEAAGAREPHRGTEKSAKAREGEGRVYVTFVRGVEAPHLVVVEREATHDPKARQVGLDHGAHRAEGLLVFARSAGELLADRAREQHQNRDIRKGCERELRTDGDHHLERARERKADVDDVQNTKAEEQPHLHEVVRGAAHDLARTHGAVETRAEQVQLSQERGAQVVLGVAPRVEDEPSARHARHEGHQREGQERIDSQSAGFFIADDDGVDGVLRAPVDAVHRHLKHGERGGTEDVTLAVCKERGAKGGCYKRFSHGFDGPRFGSFRWDERSVGRSRSRATTSTSSAPTQR